MPSISPEYWRLFSFADKTDLCGGRRGPFEPDELRPFSALAETSRGELQMRYVDGKFNVLAVDMGVGLLYDKDGGLETIGIDVLAYCENMNDEDMEKMGGEEMEELMETMALNGDRLYLNVELKEGMVALASINDISGERKILGSVTEVDFSRRNLASMNYDGYTLFFGLANNEDEFEVGVRARIGEDASYERDMNLLITVISSDCNFKTYLESKSADRFERFARRVFF